MIYKVNVIFGIPGSSNQLKFILPNIVLVWHSQNFRKMAGLARKGISGGRAEAACVLVHFSKKYDQFDPKIIQL